ncbi:hypothetical protein Salat_1214400 [Sesamum alatum]|uniref:Uncharacterized protein n=1 Tax=Sesamum alatum TaxID=300844 RepID=A0AAE1YFK7_9LAMI|nr:hypothetical protein Salat_1214400 [Sesamum alatum]
MLNDSSGISNQASANQLLNQTKMWVPKKDLQLKKSQQQEDVSRNHQKNAEEAIQKEERIKEDRCQKEKTITSATITDVQDLVMEDINSRQAPDFAQGITRKEAKQAQVEGMQNAEPDTCLKEITETGVNTSSPAENIELESKNQDLVSVKSISLEDPINILLKLNKDNFESAHAQSPLLTRKLATSIQPKNGSTIEPQKLSTNFESTPTLDRAKQQHGTSNTSINDPDPGASIPKHPTKPDQPILSNSAESADITITGPCSTYDNTRLTDEELPPGFEPGFKFQSNIVTNTCCKPKRQRGRPKLTRQSPSKEQPDQIGAV